jgi:excisionase family DNA binding protein
MTGLLIEDVTLTSGKQIDVNIRWRGGRTQSLQVQRARPIAQIRKTLPDVVQLIDELLETSTYQQIATKLNGLGHRNWRGDSFTEKKVNLVCRAYGLKSRYARLRERGLLTTAEVAEQLTVSIDTVNKLARKGWLRSHAYGSQKQRLYEPPGDVEVVRGVGGRYRPCPVHLIPVQPTEQGAS